MPIHSSFLQQVMVKVHSAGCRENQALPAHVTHYRDMAAAWQSRSMVCESWARHAVGGDW